jgi:hypothetical protein
VNSNEKLENAPDAIRRNRDSPSKEIDETDCLLNNSLEKRAK